MRGHVAIDFRFQIAIRMILTTILVATFTVPLVVFYRVPAHNDLKVALVIVFTFIFGIGLSIMTRLDGLKLCAATAL